MLSYAQRLLRYAQFNCHGHKDRGQSVAFRPKGDRVEVAPAEVHDQALQKVQGSLRLHKKFVAQISEETGSKRGLTC